MDCVHYGRKWEINTKKDLDEALETLEGNDFIAEMADSYDVTRAEQAEVCRQRADVMRQAREKGLLKEGE